MLRPLSCSPPRSSPQAIPNSPQANPNHSALAARVAAEQEDYERAVKQAEYRAFFDEWKKAKAADKRVRRNIRKRAPLAPAFRGPARVPGSRPSPYRGVSWNIRDGLWVARIKIRQRSVTLGVFLDTEDGKLAAARIYDKAVRTHFGRAGIRAGRARLNFPGDEWEKLNPFFLYGYRDKPMRAVLVAEAERMEKEGATVKVYQLCKRLKVPQEAIKDEIRLMVAGRDKGWRWKVR